VGRRLLVLFVILLESVVLLRMRSLRTDFNGWL
jgi:hypothetical protein